MALQPASGSKDLNPKQVETNHLLTSKLAEVYRKWGYEEISPPRVERLTTLTAGGAIEIEDVVKLVADEPLGLRPEMTASIARAACTRFAQRPRPLRLWASGTVFENRESVEGVHCIEENLVSGVELFGVKDITAEMELLSLLLESMDKLNIDSIYKPTLLIGHTSLIDLILSIIGNENRESIRNYLLTYDRLSLENIKIDKQSKETLLLLQTCRGYPTNVLNTLQKELGKNNITDNLIRLFSMIEPIAKRHGIELQLDPTYLPHFELYTGIVFQLICTGSSAPLVIARGGRYDELVKRCGAKENQAAGLGFVFAIDKIRELINDFMPNKSEKKIIIAYGLNNSLEKALDRQSFWHKKGYTAIVELDPLKNKDEAIYKANEKGIKELEWVS